MDHEEFKNCLKILEGKSGWFIRKDNHLFAKLDCLERFKRTGGPTSIPALARFLKDEVEAVRLKTAEVIVALSDEIKSQKDVHNFLRYFPVEKVDLQYFREALPANVAVKLIGLASFNFNGYVREAAVQNLAMARHQSAIHYILLRLGDWVKPVRDAAWTALKSYFTDPFTERFIIELQTIESIQKVERVDLSSEYSAIVNFIASREMDEKFYSSLSVSDKARFLYVRNYFKIRPLDYDMGKVLAKDKYFLIRTEILKHVHKLISAERDDLIVQLLQDPSTQVRLSALYAIQDNAQPFEKIIFLLMSDKSASIRDFARYCLKDKGYDYRLVYKDRIEKNQNRIGSILGLAEFGSGDDAVVVEQYIKQDEVSMMLSCLAAINRLDAPLGRTYALDLLMHPSNKIRRKCIDILHKTWDNEVQEISWSAFVAGDVRDRETVIRLVSKAGGWNVLWILIQAVSDRDTRVQDLAWTCLQKWEHKALGLFTTPPPAAIERAINIYNETDMQKIGITPSRQRVWMELKYYLSR